MCDAALDTRPLLAGNDAPLSVEAVFDDDDDTAEAVFDDDDDAAEAVFDDDDAAEAVFDDEEALQDPPSFVSAAMQAQRDAHAVVCRRSKRYMADYRKTVSCFGMRSTANGFAQETTGACASEMPWMRDKGSQSRICDDATTIIFVATTR